MNTITEQIQESMEVQDIEKVYQLYHNFFEEFDASKQMDQLIDLADYSYEIGFYEESRRAYTLLASLEPQESMWTIRLAELFINEGEFDQALSLLFDIPDTDPNYPAVLVAQSAIYLQQGYEDVAERKLLQAKELAPDEPQVNFYLGLFLLEMGQISRAITFLKDYIALGQDSPGHNEAFQRLIQAYLIEEDYQAVEELIEDLNLDQLYPNLLVDLAQGYLQQKNYEKALEVYSHMLLQEPDSLDALHGLAIIANLQRNFEKSNETIEEIIKLSPFSALAYDIQSKNYYALGNIEAAIQAAKKAMDMDPESVDTVIDYIMLLMKHDDFETALATIEVTLQANIFDPMLLYLQAQAYEAVEDYSAAYESYQEAEEYLKDSIDFIKSYTKFLREEGEIQKAKALLDHALYLEPLNQEILELRQQLFEEE